MDGSSLITSWLGSGWWSAGQKPRRGGRLKTRRSSVWVTGSRLPVRMKNGTPGPAPVLDVEPERGVRLGGGAGGDTLDVLVAVVLTADVVGRVGLDDRAEQRDLRLLDGGQVAARRRLHRRGGDDLHEVVDHDVAQRTDRVVEAAAVVDAEVLRHRDLDAVDVVAAPDRLEDRVGEAQVAGSPRGPSSRGSGRSGTAATRRRTRAARRRGACADCWSWPNGFSMTNRAPVAEPGVGDALDHLAEQERRDLEVEDRRRGALDRVADAAVRRRVGEVAADVGQPLDEPLEDLVVDLLSRPLDRGAGTLDQLVERPVVDRDPDDRAVEEAAGLQPVQRPEGHHPGQVAGDPEDHEDVRRGAGGCLLAVVGMLPPLRRAPTMPSRPGGRIARAG